MGSFALTLLLRVLEYVLNVFLLIMNDFLLKMDDFLLIMDDFFVNEKTNATACARVLKLEEDAI